MISLSYAQERAPTITQKVAEAQTETLWAYLSAFPGSLEFQIVIALLFTGLIGMMGNFVLKWGRKEIEDSLLRYLFITDPRKTVMVYAGYLSASFTAVGVGLFFGDNDGFVGWKAVLWFGLTTGFAADALANKGETKVFTQAERIAVRRDIKAKAKVPKK